VTGPKAESANIANAKILDIEFLPFPEWVRRLAAIDGRRHWQEGETEIIDYQGNFRI
jgi:hypothetical protein